MQPKPTPLTTPAELVTRLRHAATTAQNDDMSEPGTLKRTRHIDRVDAMLIAAEYLEGLQRVE